jgi:hypothetical protein
MRPASSSGSGTAEQIQHVATADIAAAVSGLLRDAVVINVEQEVRVVAR